MSRSPRPSARRSRASAINLTKYWKAIQTDLINLLQRPLEPPKKPFDDLYSLIHRLCTSRSSSLRNIPKILRNAPYPPSAPTAATNPVATASRSRSAKPEVSVELNSHPPSEHLYSLLHLFLTKFLQARGLTLHLSDATTPTTTTIQTTPLSAVEESAEISSVYSSLCQFIALWSQYGLSRRIFRALFHYLDESYVVPFGESWICACGSVTTPRSKATTSSTSSSLSSLSSVTSVVDQHVVQGQQQVREKGAMTAVNPEGMDEEDEVLRVESVFLMMGRIWVEIVWFGEGRSEGIPIQDERSIHAGPGAGLRLVVRKELRELLRNVRHRLWLTLTVGEEEERRSDTADRQTETDLESILARVIESYSQVVGVCVEIDKEKKGQLGFLPVVCSNVFEEEVGALVADGAADVLRDLQSVESNVGRFLSKCVEILHLEHQRVKKWKIEEESRVCVWRKIENVIVETVVEGRLEYLFGDFEQWFRQGRHQEQLKDLFALASKSSLAKKAFCDRFGSLVHVAAREILVEKSVEFRAGVVGSSSSRAFVETIFETSHYYGDILSACYDSDFDLAKAITLGCSELTNQFFAPKVEASPSSRSSLVDEGSSRAGFCLAQYASMLIAPATSAKICPSEQLDDRFNDILLVYNYLREGDVFLKYYGISLAKRLLSGRFDVDREKRMIQKLKIDCSYSAVYRFEQMFKDIHNSVEIGRQFRATLPEGDAPFETFTTVLTRGVWPKSLQPAGFAKMVPPQPLRAQLSSFDKYYSECFPGRKLVWSPHHSRGIVQTNCSLWRRQYSLKVTSIQLSLLVMLNESESVLISSVESELHVSFGELLPHLRSFLRKKVLLLLEDSSSKEGRSIALNPRFRSKRRKVILCGSESMIKTRERSVCVDEVMSLRNVQVQALVTRMMKHTKQMRHSDLLMKVVEQASSLRLFVPSPAMVKKNLERLIEMEIVTRDESDAGMYLYVA